MGEKVLSVRETRVDITSVDCGLALVHRSSIVVVYDPITYSE